MTNLNIEIDPRKNFSAEVPCPHCDELMSVTHKELRRSFGKRERLMARYPDVVPANDYVQLAEIECPKCGKTSIVHYDFTEFAMSAYAFRIIKVEAC